MTNYDKFEVFDGRADLENSAVTGRMKVIYECLDQAEDYVKKLEDAIEKYEEDKNHSSLRTQAHMFSEDLLRNIEAVESELPDTVREADYSRLHNTIYHMYWRLEDGRWKESGSDSIIRELEKISARKEIIYELRYVIRESFEQEYFRPPVDDFKDDFKQAKDLLALETYDTAIFMMCRACEQAQWKLGEERKIESIKIGDKVHSWDSDDVPAWARNDALYNVDFPDGSGKMIEKGTRKRFERIYTELRNDVAHLSHQKYSRERSIREFKNLKELLMRLSERISEIREYDGEIDEVSEQKANYPD